MALSKELLKQLNLSRFRKETQALIQKYWNYAFSISPSRSRNFFDLERECVAIEFLVKDQSASDIAKIIALGFQDGFWAPVMAIHSERIATNWNKLAARFLPGTTRQDLKPYRPAPIGSGCLSRQEALEMKADMLALAQKSGWNWIAKLKAPNDVLRRAGVHGLDEGANHES